MPDYAHLRELMVARQIARRGIDNPAILDAMCAVPREEFIAEAARQWAYEDCPLPIEEGQTIRPALRDGCCAFADWDCDDIPNFEDPDWTDGDCENGSDYPVCED